MIDINKYKDDNNIYKKFGMKKKELINYQNFTIK